VPTSSPAAQTSVATTAQSAPTSSMPSPPSDTITSGTTTQSSRGSPPAASSAASSTNTQDAELPSTALAAAASLANAITTPYSLAQSTPACGTSKQSAASAGTVPDHATSAGNAALESNGLPTSANSLGALDSALVSAAAQQETSSNAAPEGNAPTPTTSDEGALDSTVASVAAQQDTRVTNPSLPATKVAIAQSAGAESVYTIGTQTASAGGPVVINLGTTYSALPSGSGVQAVANGQTSIVSSDLPAASKPSDRYAIGSQTAIAGAPVVVDQGTTYSALLSGYGLQVAASRQTSIILPQTQAASSTSNPYIIGTQTASAGRSVVVDHGITYIALPSSSGLQVAASGRTNIIAAGSTTAASATDSAIAASAFTVLPGGQTVSFIPAEQSDPWPTANGGTRLITVGDETLTAVHIAPTGSLSTGAAVINGATLTQGATTIIGG
jgi:hypothetical protein